MSFDYIGKPRPIRDAVEKVTGQTIYTGDMCFPNMLYGKILFSPHAHAIIKNIDTSEAESLAGVKAVVTHLNSPQKKYNSALRFINHDIPATEKIFDDKVRFVGDRVAAVAAETLQIAREAINLIKVEYKKLPTVFNPKEALEPNAPLIHPLGNLVKEIKKEIGNVDKTMSQGDYIIESRFSTQMIHHCALEPHICVAHWSKGKKLRVWCPSQNVFATRIILSDLFDLSLNKVKVIKPSVGGAFGGKLETVLSPVASLLAIKTGNYVRLGLNREETMVSTRVRGAYNLYLKTAVSKKGKFKAQEIKVISNTGAYATSALNVVGAMAAKAFMLYRIPNQRFIGLPVYTNSPIAGAMRGYGSPPLFAALETHVDKIARKLKFDPVELRLKNLVHPHDINPLNKKSLGNARIIDCLEKGSQDYYEWSNKIKAQESNRYRIGIGCACAVHGNGVFPFHQDFTTMTLKLNEDGSASLFTGTHDIGEGANTVFSQIISEVLKISPDKIEIIEADTEKTSYDLGVYASRNTWVGGSAAKKVAEKVLNSLIELAAEYFKVSSNYIKFSKGFFYNIKNKSKKITINNLVVYSQKEKQQEVIESYSHRSQANPGSYGAHFACVKVDVISGEVTVLHYTAVHDVGKAINPLLLEGQIEGGIQMGLGYALTEELELDKNTGKITNPNLNKYSIIKAKNMPKPNIMLVEEHEKQGPFGAKSIGEIATIPVCPAVINAVNDALGVSFDKLPITPDKILSAVKKYGLQSKS